MRLLLPFLCFVAVPALAGAQARDLAATADTIFDRWNSTHGPGCAVGVAREGRTLLERGFGMANLESREPISPATIFESGSVAKQFTAAAVVLLALDGKLDLDAPARRYLPEIPEYDRPITVRHLLTHTSGLREWSNLVAHSGWPRGSRAHTQQDLLDVVFRQRTLNYPVGDHYSYTNSGYAIAMSLVERVSGKSFQAFSHERIFAPLGMTSTRWRDDFTMVGKDGRTLNPDEVRGFWQNLYDNSIDPLHFRYTIQALELQGDEVIATVQHEISRMNAIDGELRQVDTSSSQKETWVKEGEIWKLRRISDVREGQRLVDGAPSSRR